MFAWMLQLCPAHQRQKTKMRNLLLIAILIFTLTACGKKGALYYPDMLVPTAPTGFSISQIGSTVKLQFVLPDNDRAGRKLRNLAGVKINKRESIFQEEQVCNSCTADYHLFRKLYLDLLPESAQKYGNRIILLDGDVSAGRTYSYVVVPFTKDGVDGLAAPRVSVRLVQPTLPPVLHAESFPTEIKISFVSMPATAGRFVGYNLYRSKEREVLPYLPINREPLMGKDYIDSGLERNVNYRYIGRTLVEMESGSMVESPVSNIVEGMLKNDE